MNEIRLKYLRAGAHPDGNRIDLSWEEPPLAHADSVTVVRRTDRFPETPTDGETIESQGGRACDMNLQGETVYYYSLFPFHSAQQRYDYDPHNRVAATATAPHGMAERMYGQLPAVYHRYDAAATGDGPGPLRRFLDLPGGALDQLYSLCRAALNLHDLDRTDGRLLPLLAQWIGWRTNYRLNIVQQRNELRGAPQLYQAIGLMPAVESIVKRLIGWESRTKEFANNVFLSNRPERLNLWTREIDDEKDRLAAGKLLSLDFAYEGRPVAVTDAQGTVWLFYHSLRRDRWDIRCKSTRDGTEWTASEMVTDRALIDRHPTAATTINAKGAETLWVFWDVFDETTGRFSVNYRMRLGATWSAIAALGEDGAPETERRSPAIAPDGNGGFLLFWLEPRDGGPRVRYDAFNKEGERRAGGPLDFPVGDDGSAPDLEDDLCAQLVNGRVHLYWSRRDASGRYEIAGRIKATPNVSLSDWGAVFTLTKPEPDAATRPDETQTERLNRIPNDREPYALPRADGGTDLYFSSNRDRSWSVWRAKYDATNQCVEIEQFKDFPYNQRAPLALRVGGRTLLIYRSNESVRRVSESYPATEFTDFRYAGSVTPNVRNVTKLMLRGDYEDFQTYTYDAGGGHDDWYARDTVGIFLKPDSDDPDLFRRNQKLLREVLRQFLPLQLRPVFIIESAEYSEAVYTFEVNPTGVKRDIVELFFDSFTKTITETIGTPTDDCRDRVLEWVWFDTPVLEKEGKPVTPAAGFTKTVEIVKSTTGEVTGVNNLNYRTAHVWLYDKNER